MAGENLRGAGTLNTESDNVRSTQKWNAVHFWFIFEPFSEWPGTQEAGGGTVFFPGQGTADRCTLGREVGKEARRKKVCLPHKRMAPCHCLVVPNVRGLCLPLFAPSLPLRKMGQSQTMAPLPLTLTLQKNSADDLGLMTTNVLSTRLESKTEDGF